MIKKYFVNNYICKKTADLKVGKYRSGFLNLKKTEIHEPQYQLFFPALPYLHPKSAAQGVMAFVLGGNASSLLFERIREELGLTYGIYARANRFQGFNYIDINTGCASQHLEKVHSEVMKIITKLQKDLINPKRLEMVKASMLSSLYMTIESSTGFNTFLSIAYMRGERGDILNNRVKEIQSVTCEQIREIANDTFCTEPLRAQLIAN
ncbi:hypothetical protein BVX93_00750 [bacterium B13(2017)]|nr:hypothetical protein BVX93_00750 [bacterium B13(2017)]